MCVYEKVKIIRFLDPASHLCRNEINSQAIRVIKRNSYNDAQKFSARERENDAHNWQQSHLCDKKVFHDFNVEWKKQFIYNLEN